MKGYKFIIFLVSVILMFSSCKDNFDPQLYGTLNVTNYPKTESEYESFMMTCYMPFTIIWTYALNAGTTANEFTWYIASGGINRLFDSTTDEMAIWNNGWGGGWYFLSKADFSQCVNCLRTPLQDPWPNHFPKVAEVTLFTNIIGVLGAASSDVLPTEKKEEFIAEARLCRGLMMYYLLNLYGPLPFILDPADVTSEEKLGNLERPTLDQVTTWIMDDFDYAYEHIADTQKDLGRYNKDYARVCIMRHCLNEGYHVSGYYAKALKMYDELKAENKYSLYTAGNNPYVDLFKSDHKFNQEIIMAVSCNSDADGNNKNGNFNPMTYYTVPDDAAKKDDKGNATPFALQGGGWGQIYNVSPKFYDTYETGDKRKDVILTSYYTTAGKWRTKADVTWDGYIINKYPVETATPFQGTDYPLARWADVLLMYAEAQVRNTGSAPSKDAIDAVNQVRHRAGLEDLPSSVTSSKEAFLDALLTERGHEMLYEGVRKIDLIRFNQYAKRTYKYKGAIPTHQYFPLPNYAVSQAEETYGKTLTQTYARDEWQADLSSIH
jgi:hypothetical protein